MFIIATRIIKLKIHDEQDLFSEYDPDHKMMSEDLLSFISRSFAKVDKNNRDDYMIHIESDTPVNQESVKQRIREYFGYERDMVKKDLRLLSLKAAYLAVFGIVVLVIWYYLSLDSESVNLEVLSIIGWVAVWEATSIMIMGRHDLNKLKRNYKRMSEAKIVISEHTVNDQTTDLSL